MHDKNLLPYPMSNRERKKYLAEQHNIKYVFGKRHPSNELSSEITSRVLAKFPRAD